jgi:outer membrane protein assembly factor BamB
VSICSLPMLRIRTGRRWTRERSAAPHDALTIDLDGVELLQGAEDEPLLPVLEGLVTSTLSLAQGSALAEVSLPESGLVLCLDRMADHFTLRIASVARPARLVRRITLDWSEWSQAVARAGAACLEDLEMAAAPGPLGRALRSRLRALGRPDRPAAPEAIAPLGLWVQPPQGRGFRAVLADPDGLFDRAPRQGAAPLAMLLGNGLVSLQEGTVRWRLEGPLFLHVLELVRCGEELSRSLGSGLEVVSLSLPNGTSQVSLQRPSWQLQGQELAWAAPEVARALLTLGTDLGRALGWLRRGQARNPHLDDLVTRAEGALAALRPPIAERRPRSVSRTRPAARTARPLRAEGSLRRLRFLPVASFPGVVGPGPVLLSATTAGPALVSGRGIAAFGWNGQPAARRAGRRGGAVGPDGTSVVARKDRLLGFPFQGQARWFRPHDGRSLDGRLLVAGRTLLVGVEHRGVRALDALTGHERWVFMPPRSRRLHLAVVGQTVLAAAESAVLTGLDLAQGLVRFRLAAPLPFLGPAVAWGALALAVVGRGSRSALLAFDPHSGEVRWWTELPLDGPLPPVAAGARAWVAGMHDGRAALASVDARGTLLWLKPMPVDPQPAGLLRAGAEVVVTGISGAAVRVRRDGRAVWRLGALARGGVGLAPALHRSVLFVPGHPLRAADLRTGRILAELPTGKSLRSMAVGPRLEVAVLDEAGDLALHRLATHFAVV